MSAPRALTLVLLGCTLPGCSTATVRVPQVDPPSRAVRLERLRAEVTAETPQAAGVDEAEQAAQLRYLNALAKAAARHAEHAADFAAERQALSQAWSALAAHEREGLVEDLRGGRPVTFRLRAQALLPFARRQLGEEALDHLARGQDAKAQACLAARQELASDTRAFLGADGSWSVSDVGPPGVLARHDAQSLLASERAFGALVQALGLALGPRDLGGAPLPDRDLELELRDQRLRLLSRVDPQGEAPTQCLPGAGQPAGKSPLRQTDVSAA